jgi:hypothetical protein
VNFPLSVGSLKKYDLFGLYTPWGVGINRDFSHWAVQRNRGLHANCMSPLTLSVSSHFSLPYFLIRMAADPSCAKQHASPVMEQEVMVDAKGDFENWSSSGRKDSATE